MADFLTVIKMNKIYLMVAESALVFCAYFYGANVARAKCKIQFLENQKQTQEQIIFKERKIHEIVYKTGVDDIRSILRDKYTIAD